MRRTGVGMLDGVVKPPRKNSGPRAAEIASAHLSGKLVGEEALARSYHHDFGDCSSTLVNDQAARCELGQERLLPGRFDVVDGPAAHGHLRPLNFV
jgi:hypothetical protein